MAAIAYRDRSLYCEDVALADIAENAGTPCYVYSSAAILKNYRAYDSSFDELSHTVCYAVKANSNLAVLRLLAEAGAGFDIVSGGELHRVLRVGGDPAKIVFSGVGKTSVEINQALVAGIFVFNCESEPELALVDALAHRRGIQARVALRVNPDVDALTHEHISTGKLAHKFGVDIGDAEGVYERARRLPNLQIEGVSCHIGSQLMDPRPVMEAVDRVLALIGRLRAKGIDIRHADLGGGLGVAYKPGDEAPAITEFVSALRTRVEGHGLKVMIEPGRSIVGNAGVLLTRVLYRKKTGNKEFVIADAAMNDLIRPALYGAFHDILPVRQQDGPASRVDVVGPVCESGDFLARDREMPCVLPGDLLAISSAGAYGFVQSSNYNSRPRAAEVLVEGDRWRIVRQRETYEDLVHGEIGQTGLHMKAATLIPVEEYLRTTYHPDCDYVDGEVLERNVGERDHGKVQRELIYYLRARQDQWKVFVFPEPRVQVAPRRFRIPDVCIVAGAEPPDQIFHDPPMVCIEILSKDDTLDRMQEKIDDFLKFGVRYVWVINPRNRRAWVYTTDGSREVIDGVLRTENPSIAIPLAEVFL